MNKDKLILAVRFIAFTAFAMVIPICIVGYRYDLFTKVSKVQLSGWGIIAIIIAFIFTKYVARMLTKAFPYSMPTQILTGFFKVIVPLLILYMFVNSIKIDFELFLSSLKYIICCEIVAIPLNPLPKMVHDANLENEEQLFKKWFSKENKEAE